MLMSSKRMVESDMLVAATTRCKLRNSAMLTTSNGRCRQEERSSQRNAVENQGSELPCNSRAQVSIISVRRIKPPI